MNVIGQFIHICDICDVKVEDRVNKNVPQFDCQIFKIFNAYLLVELNLKFLNYRKNSCGL